MHLTDQGLEEFTDSLAYYGGHLSVLEATDDGMSQFGIAGRTKITCSLVFDSPSGFSTWVDMHRHYYGTGNKGADLREDHPELKRAWHEYLVLERLYGG